MKPRSPIDWALTALFGAGIVSIVAGIVGLATAMPGDWMMSALLLGGLAVGGVAGVFGWMYYFLHRL